MECTSHEGKRPARTKGERIARAQDPGAERGSARVAVRGGEEKRAGPHFDNSIEAALFRNAPSHGERSGRNAHHPRSRERDGARAEVECVGTAEPKVTRPGLHGVVERHTRRSVQTAPGQNKPGAGRQSIGTSEDDVTSAQAQGPRKRTSGGKTERAANDRGVPGVGAGSGQHKGSETRLNQSSPGDGRADGTAQRQRAGLHSQGAGAALKRHGPRTHVQRVGTVEPEITRPNLRVVSGERERGVHIHSPAGEGERARIASCAEGGSVANLEHPGGDCDASRQTVGSTAEQEGSQAGLGQHRPGGAGEGARESRSGKRTGHGKRAARIQVGGAAEGEVIYRERPAQRDVATQQHGLGQRDRRGAGEQPAAVEREGAGGDPEGVCVLDDQIAGVERDPAVEGVGGRQHQRAGSVFDKARRRE